MKVMGNDIDLFFELSTNMLGLLSPDGSFKKLNSVWEKCLGRKSCELLNVPFTSILHPDEISKFPTEFDDKIVSLKLRCRHKNGSFKDLELQMKIFSDGQSVLISAHDVTEKNAHQMYLSEMERVALMGHWSWDLNSHDIKWSEGIYNIHGVEVGTPLTSEMSLAFYPRDHRILLEKAVTDCLEKGIPYDLELPFTAADGTSKWVRTISHPQFDRGKVSGMFGVFQDITESRKRIVDYQESKNRLKFALSANKMGVWDWNIKDDILVWDDSMFTLFDLKREDFPNEYSGIESIQHPEDIPRVREAVEEAIRTGNELNTWFRITTPSGIRYIAAKGQLTNTDTDSPWLTGVNWDITKEKVQEDIINRQQAQMVTSARLSSLGEMAGGIAHEINNPLSIILGRAGQLKRKIQKGDVSTLEITDGLVNIEATCDRIVKIIKGLRAFSRNAESDPFVQVDMNQVIRDVIILISEKFKHHNISLEFDQGKSGKVMGRAVQLGQVFMNLLSNSFDAIGSLPDKWVRIKTHFEGNRFIINVIDSGHGIPTIVQEKMFQPFYTTKEVGQGTGLGLSISKGIIEDHLGRFYVDSTHKNTCFVIELPLAE